MNHLSEIPISELVQLCAVDDELYARTFFPKTVRQSSPEFHQVIDRALAGTNRYVSIKVFRDGAKTSKLRLFTSKRIAYAISHTILFVSNSQSHSIKSLEWVKRNVEFNNRWAQVFGLKKGSRWSNEDIEIIHGVDEFPIRLIALGITGQVRGVNIDDYRPDLIIVDDADSEETAGTAEQRKKTSELFFGALAKSLAPASECPDAKMVLLQTPLAKGDLVDTCTTDPQWLSLSFGCFDERGESRWPERYPTEVLLADKEAHIRRGQLALWMREKECQLVPEGGASFNVENLKYWELLPERMTYVIVIDPASSEAKEADDQVIGVLGFYRKDVYLVEYTAEKGEMPDKAVTTLIEYIRRYKPIAVVSESVAYQRVLAWYIETEFRKRKIPCQVHRVDDRRKKSDRIIQAVGAAAGYGRLWVKSTHFKFLEQYSTYSPLAKMHDDVLDMVAMGIDYGDSLSIEDWIDADYEVIADEAQPRQLEFRHCP